MLRTEHEKLEEMPAEVEAAAEAQAQAPISNASAAQRAQQARSARAVQAKGDMNQSPNIGATAQRGVSGGGAGALPHLDQIQQSFGRHDVTGARAHQGSDAAASCESMNAQAYTTGKDVAFSGSPDLHTAAHEAAHVVQQSGGVQCKGGVGQAGDEYERHADDVADAVVAGESAEAMLDGYAGGSESSAVQMKENGESTDPAPEKKPVEEDTAEALLISFPEFKIDTETFLGKVGGLGHAGVLLIRDDGFTRYYEYGRYRTQDGTKGRVRKKSVPNAVIGEDGKATQASLANILARISSQSGQGGKIDAAYFQNVNFKVMEAYAQAKLKESNPGPAYDKKRDPYTLSGNNCATFAEDVITQDKDVDKPGVMFPSPVNTVSEYQEEGNAKVTYDPKAKKGERLDIGEWDEEDAKVKPEDDEE
jgi:hypothetical protein